MHSGISYRYIKEPPIFCFSIVWHDEAVGIRQIRKLRLPDFRVISNRNIQMRYCKALIKTTDGKQFFGRIADISTYRVVIYGDYVLPISMLCDLQVLIPPTCSKQSSKLVNFQAMVDAVYFASSTIRLEFKIKSLSHEASQLIESRNASSAALVY